jgi:hypothetical protein
MIAPERLLALALSEIDGAEAEEVEAHVLSCSACAATLEKYLSVGQRVRDIVRRGGVRFALSPDLATELVEAGLIKRSYWLRPGDTVACSVAAEDVYVAAYLEADLTRATRIDIVFRMPDKEVRVRDVPFDPSKGVVSYAERADFLRSLPTHVMHCELLDVADDGTERTLGRYVFDHHATA